MDERLVIQGTLVSGSCSGDLIVTRVNMFESGKNYTTRGV
jgi:hypothetical protein